MFEIGGKNVTVLRKKCKDRLRCKSLMRLSK
jgi:hypothetical protein